MSNAVGPSTVLHQLLDDGAQHDAEYRGSMSNHLPMTLVALYALGADDTRLQAHAAFYARRLLPAPAPQTWPRGEPWPARLGQRAAWPAYRHLFAEWLERETGTAVLRQVLPLLLPGVAGAAFHGLIRVAYATSVGHAGELADALAYWACCHQRLPQPAPGDDTHPAADLHSDPGRVLAQLLHDARNFRSSAGLIAERTLAAAAAPAFARQVRRLQLGDDAQEMLGRLARLAAEGYVQSHDFTVLHLATSAHAMQVLWPLLDEPEAAVRHYWAAFAAAVLGTSWRPGPKPLPPPPDLPWPEVFQRATASDNEHVVKLVFSCREQFRASGDEVYRRAAARAVEA